MSDAELGALARTTHDVFEQNAAAYDAERSRALFEARWLARFTACLPVGGRVMDLGCGAGEPIARWFIAEGFRVTGVDFAESMLEIARTRWPQGDWRTGDMRTLDLGETFDGIVAWNSFFHLTVEEQRDVIHRMARHLRVGGSLLFTVGPDQGETSGSVAGKSIYHASLSPAEYATLLQQQGLRLTGFLAEDPECNSHSVMMARKDGD
ncbi:class I SAM-dependent methyltransferase [Primorskyibacter flagellatus]|uniref:Methyltransferase domain-containing protein n=1 Tax=Primorskyibacter flagellatus TaxID=1387277 RepID=A0A1W2DAM6_9RHOB|nr:class I SAM-dependent methyltransferase [Primorskyibacter flagellatus]SMC94116.1 Methyltransferase domain-containing protein [Primorskyibacter flagellatus]